MFFPEGFVVEDAGLLGRRGLEVEFVFGVLLNAL